MYRSTKHPLTTGAAVSLLLLQACSHDRHTSASGPAAPNDDIGVSVTELPLLAAGCSVTATTMTVTVKDGESAYVALRSSDNMVTVNGNVFAPGGAGGSGSAGAGGAVADTGRPCEISATGSTINVVADANGMHALGRSVILDYVNGVFLRAASATVPPIKIDFTLSMDNGSKNSLKVRGSDNNDSFAVGAGSTTTGAALNINASGGTAMGAAGSGGGGSGGSGGSVPTDAYPDVAFKNIPSVVISSGAGDDRLDASGTTAAGVGLAFANAVSLFGNDGNDTIIGGLGDDTIVGGLGNDTLNGCQGNDTYDMGAVASGNDIIAEACAGAMEGSDTLDYSKRTAALAVNLSHTITATNGASDSGGTSGETGETAHISDKIVNVKLGAGDDTITIPSGSTVSHKIKGGKGDDTFNGNGAQDTFDGEVGDDTCISATSIMDYSARTSGVTVSVCGSGCSSSDANDGDPSAMGSSHSGSGASTTMAGGAAISTLTATGFTAASVGNTITLSSCMTMTGADNGAFPIVEYISATSVKVDTSSVAGFVAETGGCDFSEALADGTRNMGTGATAAAKQTTGTVTGLSTTTNLLGHQLALTNSSSSTGGGTLHTNDNGTYYVVKVVSSSVVAIDNFGPAAGGTMFAGAVTNLDWVETGAEHDNIQCAHVIGGQGDDTITGDARNNVLRGGLGNDTLNGGAGNDQIYGEAGNDNLYGGAGDDTLVGSDGTDVLVGGDGNDVLEGDAGNDAFTCDGKNVNTATSSGTAPGESDFRVDYATGDTLAVTPTDCEILSQTVS